MQMRHQAAHLLESGALKLEVMDPVDPGRYNRGVRFSPVANVLRATLDGHDFLFSPAAHEPVTENCGLAMEFDICTTGGSPPGFDETAMGEGFLKVGVGVLRKDVERYSFFKAYEVIDLAGTRATWAHDRAEFEQTSNGINGYAYILKSSVIAKNNSVEVSCSLTNTGRKPFSTEQYAHNYFQFDGAVVGPDYVLKFPWDFEVTGLQPQQRAQGREIEFSEAFPADVKAVNAVIKPAGDRNEVTTINPANGLAVRAWTSSPVSRIALHATPAYLCPEMFVRIDLEPGATQKWTRGYEFEIGAPRSE